MLFFQSVIKTNKIFVYDCDVKIFPTDFIITLELYTIFILLYGKW